MEDLCSKLSVDQEYSFVPQYTISNLAANLLRQVRNYEFNRQVYNNYAIEDQLLLLAV